MIIVYMKYIPSKKKHILPKKTAGKKKRVRRKTKAKY